MAILSMHRKKADQVRRLSAVICLALLAPLTLAQDNALIEGTAESQEVMIADEAFADRDSFKAILDGATVVVTAHLRVSSLLGEPAVACAAQWRLLSVRVNGEVYHRSRASEIPEDVWQQADLYGADGIFMLRDHETSSYVLIPCDLGAMGPPDGESVSFNVAGSPDWSGFLLDQSRELLPEDVTKDAKLLDPHFLSEPEAKEVIADVRDHPELTHISDLHRWSIDGRLDLIDARINIYPIRNYIEAHLQSESGQSATGAEPGEHQPDFSVLKESGAGRSGAGSSETESTASGQTRQAIKAAHPCRAPENRAKDLAGATRQMISAAEDCGTGSGDTGARGSVVFLLDASGSMSGDKISSARQNALTQGRRVIESGGEVSVLAYAGDCESPLKSRLPFTTDTEELSRFVKGVDSGGGTPMGEALLEANRYLANSRSSASMQQMVVLLADGDDACDNAESNLDALRRQGITFRHEAIALDVDRQSEAAEQLQTISQKTGGGYHYAANATQLGAAFEKTLSSLEIMQMFGEFKEAEGGDKQSSSEPEQSQGGSNQEAILNSIEW